MPSKPVKKSRIATRFFLISWSVRAECIAASAAAVLCATTLPRGVRQVNASAAQAAFMAAHTSAVFVKPSAGTRKNVAPSTPATAPSVLAAYKPPIAKPSWRKRSVTPVMAGSVAPMAAVAGSSSANGPANAISHCHPSDGCAPVRLARKALAVGNQTAKTTAHTAISASQPAYQRCGAGLRAIMLPTPQAPSANPPKKAMITANTDTTSCPSHVPNCCVQTIW